MVYLGNNKLFHQSRSYRQPYFPYPTSMHANTPLLLSTPLISQPSFTRCNQLTLCCIARKRGVLRSLTLYDRVQREERFAGGDNATTRQLRVVSSEENARGFACRGINGFGDRLDYIRVKTMLFLSPLCTAHLRDHSGVCGGVLASPRFVFDQPTNLSSRGLSRDFDPIIRICLPRVALSNFPFIELLVSSPCQLS